jgi:outer membrane lipopolysaccharide assembly protein LptE/RlpB
MRVSTVRLTWVRATSGVPTGLRSCLGVVPVLKDWAKLGRSYPVANLRRLSDGPLPIIAALVLALCVSFSACGYHTAGHANLLPSDLRTIAIPAFLNQTQTYKIEQTLTESVVQEFVTRTSYHVTSDPKSADATLHGIVLSTYTNPLTYDTKTGRASSILVVVSLSVSLKDRQGRVLYQNPSYIFREQYQVSQELSSFFEEGSPAFQRLSKDFARTLVSNLLEAF